MKDTVLVLAMFVVFIMTISWYIVVAKDYPQCMMARDVATCVEVAKMRDGTR